MRVHAPDMVSAVDLLSPTSALRRVRSALAQARRDLSMVRTVLGGGHPPPLVARTRTRYPEVAPPASATASPNPAPVMAGAGTASPLPTRTLRVLAVREETADAVSLTLVDESGAPIGHRAGQFLTFVIDTGTGAVRRSYSISSPPPVPAAGARADATEGLGATGGTATITVKRIVGGRVSTWLHHNARPGLRLIAQGPQGAFVLPPRRADTGARVVVLYAGGSGITPCMAIARATLRDEPDARLHLVYGNRSAADVIFARDLAELVAAHAGRWSVHHFLEQVDEKAATVLGCALPAVRLSPGRLDRGNVSLALATAAELVGKGLPPAGDAASSATLPALLLEAEHFVCGPAPMMDAVLAELRARGVPEPRLHAERFTSPEQRAGQAAVGSAIAGRASHAPRDVVVHLGGSRHVFRTRAGQTLLDAALEAGVPLPFSCAVGGCGACKTRLVSGTVDVEEPNCLSAAERAAGTVLTCVGRPTSACELDFEGKS
jgi:ring-1,2-phenylacetyl-CoA epoxidase subunit PaaE